MTVRRIATTTLAIALCAALLAAPAPAEEKLPDADAVIAAYIDALGGEAALTKHSSATVSGTFSMEAMGVTGKITLHMSKETRYRMEVGIEGMGSFGEGYYDGTAWSDDPMQGPRLLDGLKAKSVALRAMFPAELHYRDLYESITNEGIVDFNGERCYRLALDPGFGDPRIEYFDVETGLLVGGELKEPGADGGALAVTTFYHDYKEFGGRLLPVRTEQTTPMGKQVITIDTVEFDSADADVAPPESVRALMEGGGGGGR